VSRAFVGTRTPSPGASQSFLVAGRRGVDPAAGAGGDARAPGAPADRLKFPSTTCESGLPQRMRTTTAGGSNVNGPPVARSTDRYYGTPAVHLMQREGAIVSEIHRSDSSTAVTGVRHRRLTKQGNPTGLAGLGHGLA